MEYLYVFQASLDRETRDSYSLVVLAYDNYQFGFTTQDSRSDFIQVTVAVNDVNDMTPVFLKDDVRLVEGNDGESVTSCSAVVTEFHTDVILTVRYHYTRIVSSPLNVKAYKLNFLEKVREAKNNPQNSNEQVKLRLQRAAAR